MISENTFRSGRKKGFIVLYREAAQDDRLTLEARGLFALMVSLPDNWEYTVSGLAVKAGCGKDKVRRLLGELQRVGYLVREQSHDMGGKFASNVYVLQDEAPLSGNTVNGENRQRSEPSTGKPLPVFTTQKNKEEKNTDLKEPPKAPQGASVAEKPKRARKPKSVPGWQPEKFEGFWKAYPRDEDRAKAVEQWDKLPQDKELMASHGDSEEALLLEISRGLKRHLESREWREDVGIPHAFRWLRDRRWTEKRKRPALEAPSEPPAPVPPRPFHTEIINGEEVTVYDESA
ncbi:hypothetical protein D1641_01155 [Colidextribacter sp. OB.20]|uniref:helix-turn-helix domain-containing protein n=1 Tax=Colidextribacter sp. OB.20 TaxID=2304568 RepID=UPI00136C89F6|nr:helix-turn-helix domain-containing protein [Colidextribacter sp. OB.20]NBI08627.1 hypothetical protein [Colidextribacter sp. OB.20]